MAKLAFFAKNHPIRTAVRIAREVSFLAALRFLKHNLRWWRTVYRTGIVGKLVSVTEYRENYNVKSTLLAAGRDEEIPGPCFLFGKPAGVRADGLIKTTRPQIELLEFQNATVLAATDFVVIGRNVIHSSYFSPIRDVCMSERFGIIKINPKTNQLYASTDPAEKIDSAISLLGQCSGNYAHFVTEVLPKLAIINHVGQQHKTLTLLVDAWMDQSLLDAISYFNKYGMDIKKVALGRPIHCQRLIYVTPVSYAPPEHRSYVEHQEIPLLSSENYKFNQVALDCLRDQARETEESASWIGRKLFLYRDTNKNWNGRNIVNIKILAELARHAGFDIVDPGTLTMREQISIFRDATKIIAPVGAALANLVFTKKGCDVICLSPHYEGAEYYYFSMLAETLGHNLKYITGPQVLSATGFQRPDQHPLHRDYRIGVAEFAGAIDL